MLDHDGDGEWQPDVNAPASPTHEDVQRALGASEVRQGVQPIQIGMGYDHQRLLGWAYQWAGGHHEGWFTPQDAHWTPEQLQPLVDAAYLERFDTEKHGRPIPNYRISAAGCRAISKPPISFGQPQAEPAPTQPQRPAPKEPFFSNVERSQLGQLLVLKEIDFLPGAEKRQECVDALYQCAEIVAKAIERVENA